MPQHNRTIAHATFALRVCLHLALTLLVCGAAPRLAAAEGVLHHFAFDYITSPKHIDSSFALRITARDDAGSLVTSFDGNGTLSATNGGAAVPITGLTSAAFRHGIWEPYVSTSTRCNALILHCANAEATVTGDANAIRIDPPAVQTVSIANTDLAYSLTTGLLYASTAGGTLVPINPEAVTAGAPVTVASTPVTTLLASDDGTQLFAVHADNQRLLRIPTSNFVPAADFPLGTNGEVIRSLATVPGQPLAIAVATTKGVGDGTFDLAIFDNGIRRSKGITITDGEVSLLNNGSSGRLLAVGRSQNRNQLYRTAIDGTGFSLLDQKIVPFNPFGAVASGDLVANTFGEIIDVVSGNLLAQTGGGLTCFDPSANRIYFLESYSWESYTLHSLDATTFEEIGRLDVPNVHGTPAHLQRWGQRGLAFRTESEIIILSGDFVPDSTSADLRLEVFDSPSPAVAGHPLTYTLRISNNGKIPAENVILTDQLPAAATFRNASTSQGSITRIGTTVTIDLGTIPAGANVLIHIQVVPPAAGSLTNVARVLASTADPSTLNNQVETGNYAQSDFSGLLHHDWIGATDIATDGDRLFVTLANTSPARPNSVATIDPATLALLRADLVGSRPNRIELTEDLTHAFVGIGGIYAMRSLDLASGVAGPIISFPLAANGYLLSAREFAPLPGNNTAVAVNCWSTNGDLTGELAIYDGATRRTVSIIDPGSRLRISNHVEENKLHALSDGFPPGFVTFEVTANGPFLLKSTASLSVSTNGVGTARIKPLGKSIVTTNGIVVDTEHHAIIAQLPCRGVIATDLDNHRVFFLSATINTWSTTGPGTLTAFDTDTWEETATVPLGNISEPVDLVRWGDYGLAFVTKSGGLYSLSSQQLVPRPPLRVKLLATATEGDGTLFAAGRVELLRPAPTPLTVTLTSSAPGVLSVPASVDIPQGATSVTFDLTVPNNNYLNGPRTVTISPAATGLFTFRPATITVSDDEVANLSLSVPAAVTEGGANQPSAGRVTLSGLAGVDIPVSLSSSDTTELAVPPTVIIPAGASSATFALTMPDDEVLDGAQPAVVTASVPGWTADSRSVTVNDNDPKTLTLTLPARLTESASTYGAGVSLSAKTLVPVRVSLVSSSERWLSVTNETTIPAGSQSATFTLLAGNDSEANRSPTITVTATAPDFTAGIRDIVIVDDDPATVEWSTISGPKPAGTSITATLNLKTLEGEHASGFFGIVAISAANEHGAGVVLPTEVYSITGATGEVTVSALTAGTQTRLIATVANGATGSSNVFTVSPVAASAFCWDPIPPLQKENQLFPVTLRAIDRFGNATPEFSGIANLTAIEQSITGTLDSGPFTLWFLHNTGATIARETLIVRASQIMNSGTLRSLAFEVATPSQSALEHFTIRLKHTSQSIYEYAASRAWEADGWTVVYQGTATMSQAGWVTIPFDTPFVFDGSSNLLIDLSFNNTASGTISSCEVRGGGDSSASSISGNNSAGYPAADPLSWNGNSHDFYASGSCPNIRFGIGAPRNDLTPQSATLSAGIWSGSMTLPTPGQTRLTATSGSLFGESNTFTVGNRPTIITQPADAAVTIGTFVSFDVSTTSIPPSKYQWFQDGQILAGRTKASLVFTAGLGLDGATFYCVVSNGVETVTSRTATLSVKAPSAPSITTQPADLIGEIGTRADFTIIAAGAPEPTYQWYRNKQAAIGHTAASFGPFTIEGSHNGDTFECSVTNASGSITSRTATLTVGVRIRPSITTQPQPLAAITGQPGAIAVTATGASSYQWFQNGATIPGATGATLAFASLSSPDAGIYDCLMTGTGGETLTAPVVVGIAPAPGQRTAGAVSTRERWQDIHHPNGAIYDQFLLTGPAGTFTADPGQIARMSYLDDKDSIVQVEMSGAGAITVVLAGASGPIAPALYNQSGILYMKGKAAIILSGADETTHFTIYSVGTATNPGVTRPEVPYAGWADVAVAGIVSSNGGLGGIHHGNASYNAAVGFTGIYAPTVTSIGGLAVVHAITASGKAQPYLYFGPGGTAKVKIAGGDLFQPNTYTVTADGLARVEMGAGQDSCGRAAPAQAIRSRLITNNGSDLTAAIVVGP